MLKNDLQCVLKNLVALVLFFLSTAVLFAIVCGGIWSMFEIVALF